MARSDLSSLEFKHDVGDAIVYGRPLQLGDRILWSIFYFSVLLIARVLFGVFTGAFSFPPYSDALSHFHIAQAWYEIVYTFHVTPDVLSRAYAEGTWPPLWHVAMAGFMLLFGNDSVVAVTFALLVNTSACALFAFFFGRTIVSFVVAAALSLSPLVTFLAFQTRPENFVFLFMVAFSFLCFRLGEKRALDYQPSSAETIFAGMAMGGLYLNSCERDIYRRCGAGAAGAGLAHDENLFGYRCYHVSTDNALAVGSSRFQFQSAHRLDFQQPQSDDRQ